MTEKLSLVHDVYPHIRIVLGMVIGLGVTRLLSGLVRIIQHPGQYPLYIVHLLWVAWMLLMLAHFWWWEFGLFDIPQWTFGKYLFVVFYSVALFMLCAFLFPESMTGYRDYRELFYATRVWFFGLLGATYALDILDTLIKGSAYLERFGTEYYVRTTIFVLLALVAMKTKNRVFHACLAVFALAYQVAWIVRYYDVI